MGDDRDGAPRAATRTWSTSPRTSRRSSSCCGASRSRAAAADRCAAGPHLASALRREQGPLLRRPVALDRGAADRRLRLRHPHPRQHRGAPGGDAELRAAPTIRGRSSSPATSRSRTGRCSDVGPDTDAAELCTRRRTTRASCAATRARFATFTEYLTRHGLAHVFADGEDPTAFDRQVAGTDVPAGRRGRRRPGGPDRGPPPQAPGLPGAPVRAHPLEPGDRCRPGPHRDGDRSGRPRSEDDPGS